MTTLKMSRLRKLITEEVKKSLLFEVGEKDKLEQEDSLDAQIDKYLINYETESRASKNEGRDFRMLIRRFLLEADEDKKEDEDAESELTIEDIDMENFVNGVIRLVDSYDSLLEVRNTILRRAVNFLIKGYKPDVARSFKDVLLDLHGLEIDKSKAETTDEEFPTPAADRAGASLGGT